MSFLEANTIVIDIWPTSSHSYWMRKWLGDCRAPPLKYCNALLRADLINLQSAKMTTVQYTIDHNLCCSFWNCSSGTDFGRSVGLSKERTSILSKFQSAFDDVMDFDELQQWPCTRDQPARSKWSHKTRTYSWLRRSCSINFAQLPCRMRVMQPRSVTRWN